MDTRKLKAFIILAETLNYHKAAEKLFITQPALTKQINVLEEVLGGELFARGPEGTILTDFGKNIYAEAKTLMNHISRFKFLAENAAKHNLHYFRLASPYPSRKHSRLIKRLQREHPEILLFFINGMASDELEHQLNQGRIQLAIMPEPLPKSLEYKHLTQEKIVVITGKETPSQLNSQPPPGKRKGAREINTELEIYSAYKYGEHVPMFRTNDVNVLLDIVRLGGCYTLLPLDTINDLPGQYTESIDVKDTDRYINFSLAWNPHFNNRLTEKIVTLLSGEFKESGVACEEFII
ncbi:LysR family transcriptional regulator [Serratia bockelmannii]|uniref:LysR family transcriptional regulator n=1 Tax=Serratia bockelmannii TaxID=2703793 RepID=UPI003FA6B755